MPHTADLNAVTAPRNRVPWYFLLATLLIAVARGLPYLVARYDQPLDPNVGFLPIGYNPPDFSAYLAFIRQGFSLGLVNPYTLDPQDGRFILLYHQILGLVRSLTEIESFTLLELSRIPMLFFFTWAAWRFIQAVHKDLRSQNWTMWLVLFSGGVEYLLKFASYLPITALPSLNENFTLLGLNTFQTFYNPLWTGALGLYLVILRPILDPKDEIRPSTQALIFIGFLILHLSHPYTSIMLLAVWLSRPALALMLKLEFDWQRQLRVAIALIPALAVCGGISLWQTRDAVYRLSASNTFGLTSVSIFLYPLILGAVGVTALRGWRYWIAEHHPWALSIGAWTLTAIFLHSSPILNGYHYIPYLHFPLCLVAVEPFLHGLDKLKSRSVMRDLVILLYCAVFFFAPLATTHQSIMTLYKDSARSKDTFQALSWLKDRPVGNVLCSGRFGLLVPVYTDHRVFVGHWFLTPEYRKKDELFYKLIATANIRPDELLNQIYINRIDYFVVPELAANSVTNALGEVVLEKVNIGEITIITLKKR